MKFHVRSFVFFCGGYTVGMSSMTGEGRKAASVEHAKKWLSLSLSQNGISLFDYVYKCVCL